APWDSRSATARTSARRAAGRGLLRPPSRNADRASSGRAEAKRPCRQQHILYGGIDRGTRRARRTGSLHTRRDPYRRFIDVVGEVLRRIEHAAEAFGAGSRRRRAGAIARAHHLVPRPFVIGADDLFYLGVTDH